MDIERLRKLSEIKENTVSFSVYGEGYPTFKLKMPVLRKIALEMAHDGDYSVLDEKHTYFEEYLIHGYLLGCIKDPDTALEQFEKYIPLVDCWEYCDIACSAFKIAKKHLKEVMKMLKKYISSRKEFETRIVLVMLLIYYLNDEWIDKVFSLLPKFHLNAYYSRMGFAWLVATMMAFYPERTLHYLKEDYSYDEWTLNKIIQKSNESFRVAREYKEALNKIKK